MANALMAHIYAYNNINQQNHQKKPLSHTQYIYIKMTERNKTKPIISSNLIVTMCIYSEISYNMVDCGEAGALALTLISVLHTFIKSINFISLFRCFYVWLLRSLHRNAFNMRSFFESTNRK